jgi:hypothetical protein
MRAIGLTLIGCVALTACGTSAVVAPNNAEVARASFIHAQEQVRHAKPSVECGPGPHSEELCTLKWPNGDVETFTVTRLHGGGYMAAQQSEGVPGAR